MYVYGACLFYVCCSDCVGWICGNVYCVMAVVRVSGFFNLGVLCYIRVGNLLLLGHSPFGLEVTLIFKGTEASWEGTKATFHRSPGTPRPV